MKFEELHNDKETNDEYLLNTVKESLNKGELCLFMSETGTLRRWKKRKQVYL